jgi:hypothetical protein
MACAAVAAVKTKAAAAINLIIVSSKQVWTSIFAYLFRTSTWLSRAA